MERSHLNDKAILQSIKCRNLTLTSTWALKSLQTHFFAKKNNICHLDFVDSTSKKQEGIFCFNGDAQWWMAIVYHAIILFSWHHRVFSVLTIHFSSFVTYNCGTTILFLIVTVFIFMVSFWPEEFNWNQWFFKNNISLMGFEIGNFLT